MTLPTVPLRSWSAAAICRANSGASTAPSLTGPPTPCGARDSSSCVRSMRRLSIPDDLAFPGPTSLTIDQRQGLAVLGKEDAAVGNILDRPAIVEEGTL